MVQNQGYISGAKVVRGGQDNAALVVFLNTAKITIKGLQYLEDYTKDEIVEENEYSDDELENQLLEILFNERGSRKSSTVGRFRKLLPNRLNYKKVEWLLNNLKDKGYIRSRRLDSYKGYDGKVQKGDIVYEITSKGIDCKDNGNGPLVLQESDNRELVSPGKVFIIHGHDNEMKKEVQLLLLRAGLDDVVLHECADKGRTIIDKLIEESNDAVYVIALLSPDDELTNGSYRARQNVILEVGYFLGKLGKSKVRLLTKGSVEIPSDLQGILYQGFDDNGAWKIKLLKEISAVGITLDVSKIINKI